MRWLLKLSDDMDPLKKTDCLTPLNSSHKMFRIGNNVCFNGHFDYCCNGQEQDGHNFFSSKNDMIRDYFGGGDQVVFVFIKEGI